MGFFLAVSCHIGYFLQPTSTNIQNERSQMKYPYTFSAKLALFPYRHHFQNHWVFKYYTFGLIASFPVFMWLSGKINSPGNIKKYEDQMAKEAAEAHGH